MKGASVEVAIWSFFSRQGLYFHHTKNQPPLRPPSTFSEHWPWFWQYLLSGKFTKKIWYKIWVITISKSAKFLAWEVYWKRNKSLLLSFFFKFFNTLCCVFIEPQNIMLLLGKLKKGRVEILYWIWSEFVQFSIFKLVYKVCSLLVYLDKKSTTQFWDAAPDTLGWHRVDLTKPGDIVSIALADVNFRLTRWCVMGRSRRGQRGFSVQAEGGVEYRWHFQSARTWRNPTPPGWRGWRRENARWTRERGWSGLFWLNWEDKSWFFFSRGVGGGPGGGC